MAKQVKKQNPKTKAKTTTPTAADFLQETSVEQTHSKTVEVELELKTPAQNEEPEPTDPATPEVPPAEQPKTEQKAVQNVRETIRGPRRGDPCPTGKCPGKLTSFSRKRIGKNLVLFLKCSACNAKPTPNKQVINNG